MKEQYLRKHCDCGGDLKRTDYSFTSNCKESMYHAVKFVCVDCKRKYFQSLHKRVEREEDRNWYEGTSGS